MKRIFLFVLMALIAMLLSACSDDIDVVKNNSGFNPEPRIITETVIEEIVIEENVITPITIEEIIIE